MCGEYMITQRDISAGLVFPDEIAYGGWPLDDHFPQGFYHRGTPNTDYATPSPYSIPYRALYSKNVTNLFFAGRNISMTHMAMSSIRVMATCGLLGQAVGIAAALATENHCTPHDVYLKHLDELQTKLLINDCFLPSKLRPISTVCRNALLRGASDSIRNGQDRPHAIYGTDEESICRVTPGTVVEYSFDKQTIHEVHLVFSSDLDRKTLLGSQVERTRSMRSNYRPDQPLQRMPQTLCREFRLVGWSDGEETELLHVKDNHKRNYHVTLEKPLEKLVLIPVSSWGDADIPVISFDFS